MTLSSNDFVVLDALDTGEITTQRQLAEHTGISLGQINYVVKRLLERGLVKVGNFKKSPKKIGYAYLLTPKGIEEKSKLAVRFVMRKLDEYKRIENRIAEKLAGIEGDGCKKIVFVGPEMVCDLVKDIVKNREFNLILERCLQDVEALAALKAGSFDTVLLSDEYAGSPQKIAADTGLPKDMFVSLW